MRLFFVSFCLVILSSCDRTADAYGFVVDSQTHLPLDSVSVYSNDNTLSPLDLTRLDGKFELHEITGWSSVKWDVYIERKGYQRQNIIINEGDSVTIPLVKF